MEESVDDRAYELTPSCDSGDGSSELLHLSGNADSDSTDVSESHDGGYIMVKHHRQSGIDVGAAGYPDVSAALNLWRKSLENCDCTAFPAPPDSGRLCHPDAELELEFPDWRRTADGLFPLTLLHAAWALAVSRLSGSDDVVFGVPTASMGQEASSLMHVPLRIKVDGDVKVWDYLREVQQHHEIAMIWSQRVSLEQLIEDFPEGERVRQYQTVLVADERQRCNTDENNTWLLDSCKASHTIDRGLLLEIKDGADQARLKARYDSRVISADSVTRLVQRFGFVLSQLQDSTSVHTVKDIRTCTAHDLGEIWNWNVSVPPSAEMSVVEMVDEQSRRTPGACAVNAWDGQLTYEALDCLSTDLARSLADHGVVSGTVVPICFEKSVWTTVALLGVLKSGGAFVLLDASLPEKRLRNIVEQVEAALIVCSPLRESLSRKLVPTTISLNSEFFKTQKQVPDRQLPPPLLSSTMYVVFTSGSTGTPKGVSMTHRNHASSIQYVARTLGVTAESRIFDFSAYSFDITIFNVFAALAVGGCLCVPSDRDRQNNLSASISSLQANFLYVTPTVARHLRPAQVPTLRTLVLIGEPVHFSDLMPWWDKVKVINTYGPSECGTASTINASASSLHEAVSIGTGVGAKTWVVDQESHNILVARGEIGELLLEGPIVGAGYIGDAEKTASSFIQDPPWLLQGAPGWPGRRGVIYKTGDLVKYDEAGRLHFHGRKDGQVKIRGNRVELGEVEQKIRECVPAATHVVAEIIEPEGESSSQILVAFLQMKDGRDANGVEQMSLSPAAVPLEVRNEMSDHLPGYMIPTLFFYMESIPTTPTGKTDRIELRRIGNSFSENTMALIRTATDGPKQQPSSESEYEMRRIWARVLRLKEATIGRLDSFLELGGDSASAMKLVAEARKAGLQLTVADVFNRPLLHEVAGNATRISSSDIKELAPFSLLGGDVNVPSLLEELAGLYNLEVADIRDVYPCTPLQEGLLSLALKSPREYIMQGILTLSKEVDMDRFRRAWETVVRETEILRTRVLPFKDAGCFQVVFDEDIRWVEASDLDEYLAADSSHVMELGHPMARYALVEGGDGSAGWFVWTIHHALFDGWSMSIILDMVDQAYHGSAFSSLPGFQPFIRYIQDQDDEAVKEYWRGSLAGCECIPFPSLPHAVEQPTIDKIAEQLLPSLRGMPSSFTTSTLVRAAFSMIAAQITGSSDVVFGTTISGRSAPVVGIDTIPGPTIATVPIRVQVEKERKVSDFLDTLQRQATEMIPFEQIGLHQIARISAAAQQACQFQTLLVIQPQDDSERQDSFGRWQLGSQQQTLNTYSLILEVHTGAERAVLRASYDSRVVKPWLVQSMLSRFDLLLHQLNQHNPAASTLADVRYLTSGDLQQLWDWNSTVPRTERSLIHQVIEETAHSQPDAMAVWAWDAKISYRKIQQLSTKIAWLLKERLVGPGQVVPLFFEKSAWTVVAILGVLKAGAAFVLLDTTMPEERLKKIVKAVDACVIISSALNQAVASKLGTDILTLQPNLFEQEPALTSHEQPMLLSVKPSSTAYVIFTSGSTGVPKGAMITHENVTSAMPHHITSLGYRPDSKVYDFSSYSFDASIHAMLASLMSGACLCVPSDDDRRDDLAGSLASFQTTHVLLTPSVAQFVSPDSVPSLQTIILGGEAVRLKDVKPWWTKIKIITAYGPSECATISTVNSDASSVEEVACIGIGSGSTTWVVDAENHESLLPAGCVGELVIEGPLVGRGYIGEPGKTAEAFIRAPNWLKQGTSTTRGREGVLYKTGDLVQYDDITGRLRFVGRKDAQVKIRGQRVELGEVEYWLQEYMPEAHAVAAEVVVPQDGNGAPILAAFVQTSDALAEVDGNLPSGVTVVTISTETRDKLAQHLPSYMMPTLYLSIRELPMTGTGKLHRKRLGEIGALISSDQLAQARAGVVHGLKRQPTQYIEQQLQDIWARVLNLQKTAVGLDDGFLQLGGDSITAMQVASLARASSIQVQVVDIIREKTLLKLAKTAFRRQEEKKKKKEFAKMVPNVDSAHLSPIQRLYFHHQHDPNVCFDQHFYLKLSRDITQEVLDTALERIVAGHASLRARFKESSSGSWEQLTSHDVLGSFSTSLVNCTNSGDASRGIEKCRQHLDITKGPIISAALIRESESQNLFITAHHLVIDLVSWRVLLNDLEDLITTGAATTPRSMEFSTWTALQAQYATQYLEPVSPGINETQNALSYWGMQRNDNLNKGVVRKGFILDKTVTADLLGSCNDAFNTRPFELLVSALIYSFTCAFKDRDAPLVHAEGHGREAWDEEIDVATTVGWFTTIFPVSTTGIKSSLRDVVRGTKDFIRSQPGNGWSHFVSRFADEASAAAFAESYPVEVLFNYSGTYQLFERSGSLFEKLSLPEGSDPQSNQQVRRFSLFEIDVEVQKGCLGFTVEFHKDMDHQEEISSWVREYEKTLRHMGEEFAQKLPEWTISELPLAFQDYSDMDEFRERYLPQLNISADDIEDIFPCTPIQEGILLAQAKDKDCYRSWFELTVQIVGTEAQLDSRKLQDAWREVVQKHALLRTVLVENIPGSDRMMNIVLKNPVPEISMLRAEEAVPMTPFQRHGLQHRISVCELDQRSARLRIEMSHAITDASSKAILHRDLSNAYAGDIGAAGGTYRDFVVFLGTQPYDQGSKFWAQHLADVEPCILPTSSSQPDVSSYVSDRPMRAPRIDTEVLRAFCARWDVTAPSIVKVAWALVLRMYTGTNTPCFGNIFSGRDVPIDGVDEIFGPLIGMVPCRVMLDHSASVVHTLRAVQDDYLSTLPYQHHPLADIHKASGNGARALFNTMFSYQRVERAQTNDGLKGLLVTDVDELDPTEVSRQPYHFAFPFERANTI